MNIQQKRNKIVLERLLDMNENDWEDDIAEILELGLEDWAHEDGFGTERQCDPRGDGRDGDFSMWNVQGVDK